MNATIGLIIGLWIIESGVLVALALFRQPTTPATGRHRHPLAYCEFCRAAVSTPTAACKRPDCARRTRDRDELFERLGVR